MVGRERKPEYREQSTENRKKRERKTEKAKKEGRKQEFEASWSYRSKTRRGQRCINERYFFCPSDFLICFCLFCFLFSVLCTLFSVLFHQC